MFSANTCGIKNEDRFPYIIYPAIPAVSDIISPSVFDTTSPDGWAADKTEPGGSLRDFHPSEVLSELSPLRAAVAGQGYHDRRMRSSQYSLPRLLLDRLGPLCTLSSFIYGFLRKFLLPRLPQVVFALLPHRFSLLGSSADVILPSDITASTVFFKVHLLGEIFPLTLFAVEFDF